MDSWLENNLVCPRDRQPLRVSAHEASCTNGHGYPIVQGIPVMLLDDVRQTQWVAEKSLEESRTSTPETGAEANLHLETLGVSPEQREEIRRELLQPGPIDPVVRYIVAHTCGKLYDECVGRLHAYPIPELRLPESDGLLLEV